METTLRKIRKAQGYSLRGLAGKTGINYTRAWRHEGRVEPLYPRDVERYCQALGVAAEDIRGSDGLAKVDGADGMLTFAVPAAAVEQGGLLFVVVQRSSGKVERYSLPLSDVAKTGTALIEGGVLKEWIAAIEDMSPVD